VSEQSERSERTLLKFEKDKFYIRRLNLKKEEWQEAAEQFKCECGQTLAYAEAFHKFGCRSCGTLYALVQEEDEKGLYIRVVKEEEEALLPIGSEDF